MSAAEASSAADGLFVQRVARAEVFAVAEDRSQRGGDRPQRRVAAREAAQGKAFEAGMQSFRQRRIGVAVGEERAEFEIDGVLALALSRAECATIAE